MNRAFKHSLGLLCVVFLLSGCASLTVESEPPGADIILNNKPTGRTTPAKFGIRHLTKGTYDVTLKKEGYKTLKDPEKFRVAVRGGSIAGTVVLFVPIGFIEIFGDQWKGLYLNTGKGKFADRGKLPTRIRYCLEQSPHYTGSLREARAPSWPEERRDGDDIPTRLKKLKELRDADILTEEEYETRRKALVEKL